MKPKITALLVMPPERRRPLLATLDDCGMEVFPAGDRAEARRTLGARRRVQVVLTDAILPDGSRINVLEDVRGGQSRVEVIVCARLSDARLWCDVLGSGAYDLLVEPYEPQEVRRIVRGAAARSYMRALPPGRELRGRIGLARKADVA